MKICVRLFILCFLSAVLGWYSLGWSATEYLYPITPDDISLSGWTSTGANKWSVIDDTQGSPDDTDYIKTATANSENDGTIANPSVITGSDTINYIIYYFRGQESGGERITAGITGTGITTHTTDLSAATWTNANSGQLTTNGGVAWTLTNLNNLQWYVKAVVVAKDTHVEWRVSQFYIEVNYTAAPTSTPKVIIMD